MAPVLRKGFTMANADRPNMTRPLELHYVQVPEGERYSPHTYYDLVPASAPEPDTSLRTQGLSLTVLNFMAGDLPGEDDWDASFVQAVAAVIPRFRKKADEMRRRNEAYLKLRVAYWKQMEETVTDVQGHEQKVKRLDDGPYYADQAFQFVVDDKSRAGGFTDRQVFDAIRIRDSLKLHIFLQELDEFDRDVAPYSAVLKDTGLDAVVNLSGPWASVAPIVSGIVKNIAKLNKSDTVFDQEFTITTTDAIGQSKLREGLYVAVEASPSEEIPPLWFRNNHVYGKGRATGKPPSGEGEPFTRYPLSYLVFNIYKTPRIRLLDKAEQVREEIRAAYGDSEVPQGLWDLVNEAAEGAWEEEAW
jgi:hypothetical protein